MGIFKKEKTVEIPSRVKRLTDSEVIDLLSTCIMQLGASFDAYRYHQAPPSLVSEAVDNVQYLWLELQSRNH